MPEPEVGITGRILFRYADGSSLEWSTKEPHTEAEVHAILDRFAELGRKSQDSGSET